MELRGKFHVLAALLLENSVCLTVKQNKFLRDLSFPQLSYWGCRSSGEERCVAGLVCSSVSKKGTVFIFKGCWVMFLNEQLCLPLFIKPTHTTHTHTHTHISEVVRASDLKILCVALERKMIHWKCKYPQLNYIRTQFGLPDSVFYRHWFKRGSIFNIQNTFQFIFHM